VASGGLFLFDDKGLVLVRRERRGRQFLAPAIALLVVLLVFSAVVGARQAPPTSRLAGGPRLHGDRLDILRGDGTGPTDEAAAGGPAPADPNPAGDAPITPPPAHFDAPAAPSAPPPAALQRSQFAGVQPADGVWAAIIGINDYPGTRNDLRSAVNDANDVDQALAGFGVPASHRLVVRDTQASAGVVRASADWLVAHASANATAVLFYAGHVRKLSSSTEAIVAADGGLVTDADLAQRLQGLRAAHTWIGIAACFGGGFDELLGPGRVLTAAADASHLAYENESFGRSYMVEYMVRQAMIQGAAPATIESAFAYAKAAIDRDYPGRAPVQYDDSGGVVDVHEAPPPAPPPPPTPSHGTSGSGSGGSPGSGGSTPPPKDSCSTLTLGVLHCH
jgi:Caspase domain